MSLLYTNFAARNGGNNLNAGTLLGDTTVPGTSASFTYTGGTFSTNTFTTGGANPVTDGVTAGMFAQVSDGTNIGRIARIASVTSSTIVLDGTATITVNAGTYTQCRVGGAWAGPSGTNKFPLTSVTSALVNSTGNMPRINFCSDATYTISSATTISANSVSYQGYTTAYEDGGRPTFDGGATGSAYTPWSFSGSDQLVSDIIFNHNGNSGAANLVSVSGSRQVFRNCDATNSRFQGFNSSAGDCRFINCYAYSNTSDGWNFNVTTVFQRCIAYSNGGSGFSNNGSNGFSVLLMNCVAYNNTSHGYTTTGVGQFIINCDFYNNGGAGVNLAGTSSLLIWWSEIVNSNFVKNGTYGIAQPNTRRGYIRNCGFGSGTQANSSGAVQSGSMTEYGSITYTANTTPWNSPGTGDFTITSASAKNAGYGPFPTAAFTGYPDIGAAQHLDAGGGGTTVIVVEDE